MYRVITAAKRTKSSKLSSYKFDSFTFYRDMINWINNNFPDECEIRQDPQYTAVDFDNLVLRRRTDMKDLLTEFIESAGYAWYATSDKIYVINGEIFITLTYSYTPNWRNGYITIEYNNSNILFEDWYDTFNRKRSK